jgi:lysophospholipase L1-like esterase
LPYRTRQCILFNAPNVNEALFPAAVAKELRRQRDYHNARSKEFCQEKQIPLADICSRLKDEHFADELHPNEQGAKIIAVKVFKTLAGLHEH